jgi:hypothetical protein
VDLKGGRSPIIVSEIAAAVTRVLIQEGYDEHDIAGNTIHQSGGAESTTSHLRFSDERRIKF